MKSAYMFLLISATIATVKQQVSNQGLFISNADTQCLRCLCFAATSCNLTVGCVAGYCGPYKISRVYWVDAGQVILPDDQIERAGAYEDCAINYQCAQKMLKNYLSKYGRDCNGDGRVNCEDFSMINFNGGYQCNAPLNKTSAGRKWLDRYYSCYPRTPDAEF